MYLHLIVQTIIYVVINKTTRERIATYIRNTKEEVINSMQMKTCNFFITSSLSEYKTSWRIRKRMQCCHYSTRQY